MHHKRRLILIGLLAFVALVWPGDRATAQVRSIFRPRVPDTSTVRTVGQVDPAEPIEIVINNVLTGPLGIGFAGGANVEVAPGESAKLVFTTVPVNLFVYPLGQEASVRSQIDIDGNTITADIMPLTSVAPGDISLNIDGAGLVYIY
jgi:hypothetical protein